MTTPATTFTGAFWDNAALAVGTSPVASFVYNTRPESYSVFTVQVSTTGAPASYSVQLEGSMDKFKWTVIGTAVTADGVYAETTANIFYPYIRGNITAVSGGASPKITMYWVASS